jgi:hypothetical protein
MTYPSILACRSLIAGGFLEVQDGALQGHSHG